MFQTTSQMRIMMKYDVSVLLSGHPFPYYSHTPPIAETP